MEVRIYDKNLVFKGIIENQTSLIWQRKYNETGNFTLTVPGMPRNVELLKPENLVWVKGKAEAGVIESLQFTQDNAHHVLQVKGRFLESYMDRRLIYPTTNYDGTVEGAMRSFFSDVVTIPLVTLGEDHGYTDEISVQASYGNLLEYEENLAKSAAYGFRFRPDFENKSITFEIYKGLDHTKGQNDRTRVTFSEEYANLISIDYTYNNQLYYNVCYVSGEGEDDGDPWKIYVEVGDTESTGLDRRELYINGQSESNGLTINQYREKLKAEGQVALDEHAPAESLNCVVNPNGNFIYGTHYDIGDIVTVEKKDWGVSEDLRITSISEVYEQEIPKIEVTLGTPLAETISWR